MPGHRQRALVVFALQGAVQFFNRRHEHLRVIFYLLDTRMGQALKNGVP